MKKLNYIIQSVMLASFLLGIIAGCVEPSGFIYIALLLLPLGATQFSASIIFLLQPNTPDGIKIHMFLSVLALSFCAFSLMPNDEANQVAIMGMGLSCIAGAYYWVLTYTVLHPKKSEKTNATQNQPQDISPNL